MPSPEAALSKELRTTRTAFRQPGVSFVRLRPRFLHAATPASLEAPSTAGLPARRRPRRLSAKQRATLKLQGKYMGTMRGLKPGQRAKVKKIRAEKGIRAAIKAAERMASPQ